MSSLQKLINFWLIGGTVGTRTDKENEEKNVKMKRVSILLKAIAKQFENNDFIYKVR